MFRIVRHATLVALLLTTLGCARNYYNIPRETFEKKVRVLGIAPIFVDGESDIRHPEKEALVKLIKDVNVKNDKELVARLKETGSFFSVRPIEGDPDQLFSTLVFRRERRDDAGVVYNKYFYKLPELRELITSNHVDAVMFTVVSGLTRKETVFSSNLLSYLESDYNFLVMTAQILDGDGNILWEYPNFRQHSPSLPALLPLQYPDFDEAKANASNKVEVKFKTIPGIGRALNPTEESAQGKAKYSTIYGALFDDMTSLLQPETKPFWAKKEEKRDELLQPEAAVQKTAAPAAPTAKTQAPATAAPAASTEEVIEEIPADELPVQKAPVKELPIEQPR